jgi:hypothetical protein
LFESGPAIVAKMTSPPSRLSVSRRTARRSAGSRDQIADVDVEQQHPLLLALVVEPAAAIVAVERGTPALPKNPVPIASA